MVKKRKNSVAVIFNGYKNSVRFGLNHIFSMQDRISVFTI